VKQQEQPTIEIPTIRPRSPWRKALKVFVILGVIFGVLYAGTFIYANFYVHGKFIQTHRKSIKAIDPLPPGKPYNVLVLGSDRRDVVEASERQERQFRGGSNSGRRADTILLIHVPADQKSATILSFPRDLRVKIPGVPGLHKINGAYNYGPNRMIQTVKLLTGLPIHHYVEINFASFQKVVDAVGGVRLCVNRTYDDKQSGLIIRHPGCQNFDGKLALAYVRMRKSDPRGDFGRIDRQQQFMRVLMSKVTSIGFLTDLPRLFGLANAVAKGVITDSKLTLGEVKGIANKLAGFKQSNVDFRVVPSHSQTIGGVSYVIAESAEAKALYTALLHDTKLPDYGKTNASIATPGDITVRVENGTTTAGLGATIAEKLKKLGFKVRKVTDASRRDYRTTQILFNVGLDEKAALISEYFPGADIRPSTTSKLSTDVVIIVGADAASRASPSPSG
jgi:LCP family protein required for cell wall assembly